MTTWFEGVDEDFVQEIKRDRKLNPFPQGTAESWPYETVAYRIEGAVAYAKLQDLRNSNGLTSKTTLAMKDLCLDLMQRPDVKVLVLTAGGKYFCTGGAFAANDPLDAQYGPAVDPTSTQLEQATVGNANVGEMVLLMMRLPQFKIASIRGENMGAGNSLICCMDHVIMPKTNCSFHFLEVKRGVAACPTWQGVLYRLGTDARKFTLIADQVFAEDALANGLAHELVDDKDTADRRANAKGAEIAALSVEDIRAAKKTGAAVKKPLMQMPPAIKELDAMQMEPPDYEEVIAEAIEASGRTGRQPEARLSKEMWTNSKVKFERTGQQVMVITLVDPDSNNVIDAEMLDGLLDAAIELHKSHGKVRLLMIRAVGDSFCSGVDKNVDSEQLQRLLFLFHMIPMCTIGIVQGKVSGFGAAFCSTFDHVWGSTQSAIFDLRDIKDEYSGFMQAKMGPEFYEKMMYPTSGGTAYTPGELHPKYVSKTFSDLQELDQMLEAVCERVTLTAPNGVSDQKVFIARTTSCVVGQAVARLNARHIAARTTYDNEMPEAMMQLADKSYVPKYATKVSASVKPQLLDASDLI